jgi:hypothetical protein
MKPFTALLMTSLVLGACEKSNDITQLHEEAVSAAKYYGPRVDELAKRKDAIFQMGRNVPGNLPDVPEIVKLITDASDKIAEMKGIVGSGPDGKSAMEKQADGFLKDGKIDELGKMIDESHEKLDDDWTIANDDLTKVEGWLWSFQQGHAAPPPPAPPVPAANNTTEAAPAAGSAAEAPKAEDKKADDKKAAPKADDKKAAPKADDKKAAPKAQGEDKKAAAPKAEKAGAPKAGAGSAAK